MPAPKGTGLCVEPECQKILKLAGIKDVWSKTFGQTKTKINLVKACFSALKQLIETKIQHKYVGGLGIVEGKIATEEESTETIQEEESENKEEPSNNELEKVKNE